MNPSLGGMLRVIRLDLMAACQLIVMPMRIQSTGTMHMVKALLQVEEKEEQQGAQVVNEQTPPKRSVVNLKNPLILDNKKHL